jgi:hypothetical protein
MEKIAVVEEAKAVMAESVNWSVMKWLREKKRVRRLADDANAALDVAEKEVKAHWSAKLTAAYASLKPAEKKNGDAAAHDAQLLAQAKKIKEADELAYRVHMDAEDTFDEADRKLSTSLAREGSRKAIDSWELHEAAIRRAESAMQAKAGK